MPTLIRSFSPFFLDFKLRKDDSGNELVSVLYEVTRADTKMLDGEQYTWPSLKAAAEDSVTQQDIADGAMFGYLEHQQTTYTKKGKALGFHPDPTKRLFKVASLWADEEEKRILSWADYLANPLGIEFSEKIRKDGFKPSVSMTSFVQCSDSVCDVLRIVNYDQVKSPNMPSAVMLSFNSSEAVQAKFLAQINAELEKDEACCSNCVTGEGECESKRTHKDQSSSTNNIQTTIKSNNFNNLSPDLLSSRSGKSRFYQNSRLGDSNNMYIFKSKYFSSIRQDSAILSLEAIYGMALGGWLTAQGVTSLGYWVECQKDMATKSKDMAKTNDAEEATESTMLASDSQYLNDRLVEINKTYQANRKDNAPVFADLLASQKKEDTANAQTAQSEEIKTLTAQVSELTKAITVLTTDSSKTKETPALVPATPVNPKAEIEQHLDSILSKDSIVFQDGKIVYQKKSFAEADIKTLRDNALKADSKENAVSLLEFGFSQLSKHKAANFLKDKGFDMAKDSDTKPVGTTTTAQVTNSKTSLEKFTEGYMDVARVTNLDLYKRVKANKDSAAYQEKVKPIKNMVWNSIDNQIKAAYQYASDKGLKTDAFEGSTPEQVVNNFINWVPVEANKGDFRIKKDAFDQANVNSLVHVILPTISSALQSEAVEQLDILLDIYSGLGMESLDTTNSNTNGFGLIFNFEQDFAATATGNDDDPDNLELMDDGESVFEEISSKNGRYEFISKQYGALLRLSRTHWLNLAQQKIDLVARQQFRLLEKMGRDQTTRGLRELFRVAGDAGAVQYVDTVANVAASGSQAAGGRYYTGEFAKPTAGTAATLAGKTFGGASSNIDMIIKLLGGQTSNSATQNVPVAKNRVKKSRNALGEVVTTTVNPVKVEIGSTNITEHEGEIYRLASGVTSIRQKKGGSATPLWALDEDGFIVLKTGAGQGANPTSSGAQIVVTYYAITNLIRLNIDSSTNDVQKFWDDYIYGCADANSLMAMSPNYMAGDMVLHSDIIARQIRKSSVYRKDNSPTGANLLSIDNRFAAVYDDLTHVGTNATLPFGSGRSLIVKKDYPKMNMYMESMSDWYRAQKADTSTGKIKTLDAVCSDVICQETFGIPIIKNPTTGKSQVPMKIIVNYGILKSLQ